MTLALFLQVTVAVLACALQLLLIRKQDYKSSLSLTMASWYLAISPFGMIGAYLFFGLAGISNEMAKLLSLYTYSGFFATAIGIHLVVAMVGKYYERHPKRFVIG